MNTGQVGGRPCSRFNLDTRVPSATRNFRRLAGRTPIPCLEMSGLFEC